jgi:DNA-binding NarL/FixJ family response regulator
MQKHLNIIVADDHDIVRQGIRFTLANQYDMDILAEASSYAELISVLEREDSVDLLILDLNLGDKSGIDTISQLHQSYPSLKILVLSMYPQEPYALQSIQAGAYGYVSKESMSDELQNAIASIIDGKKYLHQDILDTMLLDTDLDNIKLKNPLESLSSREYEVFELISEGLTYKEISERLELSPKTVSTYRSRILEKLSLSNTNQLIQFASANKLGKI